VVVLASACGSRAPAPAEPHRPDAGHVVARHADVGSADHATHVDELPLDGHPTSAECEAAIDHMIDLDVAERPADQKPVADELAKARSDTRTQFVPRCTRELTRAQTRCITAGATLAATQQCT
jgi:hypothetical protein